MRGVYETHVKRANGEITDHHVQHNHVTLGVLYSDRIYNPALITEVDLGDYSPEVACVSFASKLAGITNMAENPNLHVGSGYSPVSINDTTLKNFTFGTNVYSNDNKHIVRCQPVAGTPDAVDMEWIAEFNIPYSLAGDTPIRELGLSAKYISVYDPIWSRTVLPDAIIVQPGDVLFVRYRLTARVAATSVVSTFSFGGVTRTATFTLAKPLTRNIVKVLGYHRHGPSLAGDSPPGAVPNAIDIPNSSVYYFNDFFPQFTNAHHPDGRWVPAQLYQWVHGPSYTSNEHNGLLLEGNVLKGVAIGIYGNAVYETIGYIGEITINPPITLIPGERYRLEIAQLLAVKGATGI